MTESQTEKEARDKRNKEALEKAQFFLIFCMFYLIVVLFMNVISKLVDHTQIVVNGHVAYGGPSGLIFWGIVCGYAAILILNNKLHFLGKLKKKHGKKRV